MKKLFFAALILALSAGIPAQAKQLTKEQLPPKLLEHFKKKHPKTSNLVITEQKHFGQNLYKLSFTEDRLIKIPDTDGSKLKQEMATEEDWVYYRTGGQFFVNAQKIEAFNVIPAPIIDGLKAAFPDYKITAAQMIPNPNGPGEEYEIEIMSGDQKWNVGLDRKGTVLTKDNLTTPAAPAAPAKPAEKKPAEKKEAPAPVPKK